MTDKQPQENEGIDVETLEASYAIIAPDAERLVERFYEELFERHPTVQPLFADSDMKSQQAKLLAALKLVIASLRDEDTLVPALQEMGRRHEKYGAEPDHYVAFASVLLSVMAEIAGEQWTDQVQTAWCNALALIAEIMIGAYDGLRAEVEQQSASGPTDGIERRSADRPWTAPKTVSDTDALPDVVPQQKSTVRQQ